MERIVALEEAIEKKNLVGIYSVFYTIAHGDPNFSTNKFRNVLNYVKNKNIEGLFQEYDGEEFEKEENWDEDYWALVASSLMDNFCEERINHLECVGKKVYPIKQQIGFTVLNNSQQTDKRDVTNNKQRVNVIHNSKNQQTNRFTTVQERNGAHFNHSNTNDNNKSSFVDKMIEWFNIRR